MHKRIIWTLFFAAFILDYFRSRTERQESKPIKNDNKEKEQTNEIYENNISNNPKEKMKAKFNDEELEVTYEDNNNDFEKKQKKGKNKNKIIDLRIEFCQS